MRFPTSSICNQQSLRPAGAFAQSDQSLCLSLDYSMSVKILTEHHLELLSLKGGSTDSSETTLVKVLHCCKSHVTAHISYEPVDEIWVLIAQGSSKGSNEPEHHAVSLHGRIQRGVTGCPDPTLKSQNIGFLVILVRIP